MKVIFICLALLLVQVSVFAQLERKLANPNQPVELIFHAPRHINLLTVEPLDKKSMHFAIMHTFGTLDGLAWIMVQIFSLVLSLRSVTGYL
jgi:hypothetical protein